MKSSEIKVISVLNNYEIVINRGSEHGVKEKDKFIVYNLDEELFDPDTKESLGRLEVVCGKAVPSHIQLRMTTLISDSFEKPRRKIKRRESNMFAVPTEVVEETDPVERLPFDDVCIGISLARKV